jgi:hypothetical protein
MFQGFLYMVKHERLRKTTRTEARSAQALLLVVGFLTPPCRTGGLDDLVIELASNEQCFCKKKSVSEALALTDLWSTGPLIGPKVGC